MDAEAAAEDYRSSLNDLVANSKPLINMLTMLADENQKFAQHIVEVIESHIHKVKSSEKLPALYLIDSIIKNARESPYVPLFTKNIAQTFRHVFEQVDEKTRQAMFKLRQTWNDIFPPRKLYTIDVLAREVDPAWPVTAIPLAGHKAPSTNIHVNPKFLKPGPPAEEPAQPPSSKAVAAGGTGAVVAAPPPLPANHQQQQRGQSDGTDEVRRQAKHVKQEEYLRLQQLEQELAQAKAQLERLERQKQQPAAPPAAQSAFRKTEELQDPRISSRPRDAPSLGRDQRSISVASGLMHHHPSQPMPLSDDGREPSSARVPSHALANHGAAPAAPASAAAAVAISGPNISNQREPSLPAAVRRHGSAAAAAVAAAAGSHSTVRSAGWPASPAVAMVGASGTSTIRAEDDVHGAARNRKPAVADPRRELAVAGGAGVARQPADASGGKAATMRLPLLPEPPASQVPAPSGAPKVHQRGAQSVSKRISPIRDTAHVSRGTEINRDKDERVPPVRDAKQERGSSSGGGSSMGVTEKDSSLESKPAKKTSDARVAKASRGLVRSCGEARPSSEPSTGNTAGLPAEHPQQQRRQQQRLKLEDQDDRISVDRARIPLKDAGVPSSTNAGRGEGSEGTAKRGVQDKDERLSKSDRHKVDVGRSGATDVDMRASAATKSKDSSQPDVKKESHIRGDIKDKKQSKIAADDVKMSHSTAIRSLAKGAGSRPVSGSGVGTSVDGEDSTTAFGQMRPPGSTIAAVDKDERVKPSLKGSLDKDDRGAEPKKSPIMAMKIPKKQPADRTYRRHRSPDGGLQQRASPEAAYRSRSRSPRSRASAQQATSSRGDFDMRQKAQSSPLISESPLPAPNAQQREDASSASASAASSMSGVAAKSSAAAATASAAAIAPSHDDVDMRKVQPAVPPHKSRPSAEVACDDVDLRVHSRKRQTLPEDNGKDLPLMKKGRRSDEEEDDFDDGYNERGDLFGLHDQDYRRYSAGPPPASPAAHSGWTAFKESHMRNFVHPVDRRSHAVDNDTDLRQQQSQQFNAPYRGSAPRSPVQSPHTFFGGAPPRHVDAAQQQDQLRSLRSKAEWRYHNGEISRDDYQDALARLEELQRLRPTHGREWQEQHRDRLPSSGSPGPMQRFPTSDMGAPGLQPHRPPQQNVPFGQPPPVLRSGPGMGRHSPVGRNLWDWQQPTQSQESSSTTFGPLQQPPQPGSNHFAASQPAAQHNVGYGQAPLGNRFSPPQQPLPQAGGGRFTPPPPLSGRYTPPPTHSGNFVPPAQPPPSQHQDYHGQQRNAAGYSASQSSLEDERMGGRYATALSSPMPGQMARPRFESLSEVVIDGKPYELTLGLKPRMINIGGRKWMIRADKDTREILIDEVCYYRLGDPPREFMLAGQPHAIFFHGHRRHIWVDGLQRDVRMDAPPQSLVIGGRPHTLRIESHTNKLIVDGIERGVCTCGPIDVDLGGTFCRISFEPPPKQILIDGKVCELNFEGPLPVVVIDGRMHGIRFDGPPREILIDDIPYLVRMDQPTRIKLGRRAHNLAFGGPGHEVVIDGKHYEVIFNGPPREVNIGGSSHVVRLAGDPPGVKILGEVVQGDPRPSPVMPGGPLPPLPPPTQPLRLPASGMFGLPPQPIMLHGDLPPTLMSMQPPPFLLAPPGALLSLMPPPPLPHPVLPSVMPPPAAMPAAVPAAPVDVNELFSKLLQYGIISKKDPDSASGAAPAAAPAADERLEDVPDLTDLSEEKLKVKHLGVLQRLYVGTQCATCGMRFLSSEANKYNQHLDWHFRQNKREKEAPKTTLCRKWYFPIDVWVTYEEFTDADESNIFLNNAPSGGGVGATGAAVAASETVSCPVATGNEKDDVCAICGDPFEHFWDEEEEAWHLKDAIRVKAKTYHPICYEDACETSTVEPSDALPSPVVKDEVTESQGLLASEHKESSVTPSVPVSGAVLDDQAAGDDGCTVRPTKVPESVPDAPGLPASMHVEGAGIQITSADVSGASVDNQAADAGPASGACPAVAADSPAATEADCPVAPAAAGAVELAAAVFSNATSPPHNSIQVPPAGESDSAIPSVLMHSPDDTGDDYDEPGTPVQDERVMDDDS